MKDISQENHKISLNNEQKAAAEAPCGPLLIVAGAGTGKTRTLMGRIQFFIEKGIMPNRICAITFTNKAAKEMESRLITMGIFSVKNPKKPFIGTFHSLGARILRHESGNLGRSPNFTIFDDHDSFDLLKKVAKGVAVDSVPDGEKKETPGYFMENISHMKNLGKFSLSSRESRDEPHRAGAIFERYEAALQENNAFDFDDLIEKVVALFKKRPDILLKYQNMFDAILVDEYQDINPRQHELVRFLAAGHKNLSVVGDDEQTIYGWRYADIGTFLNFEKEWPGSKIHFLEENYRSTGIVIRAAAAVVKNNRLRAPKNLWTKNPDGNPIILYEGWGEGDESAWITARILRERSENPKESIAVLYRTNAQSRAIEQSLIRRGIPYRIFGGLKFYDRREIKDIVAGLRYAANPKDALSRERLEKNLTKRKFSSFQNALTQKNQLKPAEIISIFMEVFSYFAYIDDNFTNTEERHENIAELISFAAEFEDLTELLERLSLLQSTDDENRSGGQSVGAPGHVVNLMTIHMSKGLEFDSVFLAGVSEGILPHGRSIDKESSLEEERRLVYVAMTRARKRLYISFSGMPSRFIGEIPPESLKLEDPSEFSRGGEDGYNNEENYITYE